MRGDTPKYNHFINLVKGYFNHRFDFFVVFAGYCKTYIILLQLSTFIDHYIKNRIRDKIISFTKRLFVVKIKEKCLYLYTVSRILHTCVSNKYVRSSYNGAKWRFSDRNQIKISFSNNFLRFLESSYFKFLPLNFAINA